MPLWAVSGNRAAAVCEGKEEGLDRGGTGRGGYVGAKENFEVTIAL